MITKTCSVCEKEFKVYPYRSITSKYCSYKCSGESKKNGKERVCRTCGKLFTTNPSQFKYYKGAGKYCSRECSYKGIVKETSKKPIMDKYGRSSRKADKDWKEAVRLKYDYTCERCGVYQKYIHTHHVKPRGRYPELKHSVDNGKCLCNSCHSWVHNHPKDAHYEGLLYVSKYDAGR